MAFDLQISHSLDCTPRNRITMSQPATHLDCSLPCVWRNTGQCLRGLVDQSVLQGAHLGQCQMSGVKALYYPHELPPCVKPDGSLHWEIREDADVAVLELHFGNEETPDW